MKDVQEALDRLAPEATRISDWEAVLREARRPKRSLALQLAVATGIAALAALFVAAPWQGSERVGILDKALAAVGDGQVVHVVFRGDWGGTLVDLKTGERKPLYGENEIWYDERRNLAHEISRFGDAVESEEIYSPEKPASELTALTREYRQALQNGTAHVTGKDTFDGTPVYWVTIRRLMLPDVADHRDHEFAEEVAISAETYKPVAMRALRDRQTFDTQRVVLLETVDVSQADFTRDPEASLDGRAMMQGSHPISIERAADVLGRTPLWLGPSYAGLPLAQTQQAVSRSGSVPTKRLITGSRADQIRDCLRDRPRRSCPRPMGAIEQRGGKIYELGQSTFGPLHTGLTFFYGTVGDEPSTFKKELVPLWNERHVVVTQTTDSDLRAIGSRPIHYLPPEGSIVVAAGQTGHLVRDGLYVTILASSDDQILEAARALRPMPNAESGAGE
jgi:hypothetical protein